MYIVRYTTARSGYVRSTTFRDEGFARTRFRNECNPAYNARAEIIGPTGSVLDAWTASAQDASDGSKLS